MTIDEAIAHAREKAEWNRRKVEHDCVTGRTELHPFCDLLKEADEHEQIAEWLEELKIYKECNISKTNFSMGYNKAIDDFVNACKEDILCQSFGLHANGIERIVEQLKAGGKNE